MSKRIFLIGILILLALMLWWVCKKSPNKGTDIVIPDVIGPETADTMVVLADSDSVFVDVVAIPRPPLEVFVLDQFDRPSDNGTAGNSYTAKVYVLDNTAKKLNGPYKGSTFPNSVSNTNNKPKSNTVKMNAAIEMSVYVFNNLSGHKGGTIKGLNLIDEDQARKSPGYKPDSTNVTMQYVNVHKGASDKGNHNSRGSLGCLTLLPSDTTAFFVNFNFENGTTGTSSGVISVVRSTASDIEQIIKELKNVYE